MYLDIAVTKITRFFIEGLEHVHAAATKMVINFIMTSTCRYIKEVWILYFTEHVFKHLDKYPFYVKRQYLKNIFSAYFQ